MDVIKEISNLQRRRTRLMKTRNMNSNRLEAVVASDLGYHSGMKESDRKKLFTEARKVIKGVEDDKTDYHYADVVQAHLQAIACFERPMADVTKSMEDLAQQLPVADWVRQPEQKGFKWLFLAIVIGETGDLANYANPAKVWRRMGCAPFTFDGKTQMGATWKSGKYGKLTSEAWSEFGYSPRRRSIAYQIGANFMMQNFTKNGKGNGDRIVVTEAASANPSRAGDHTLATESTGAGSNGGKGPGDNISATDAQVAGPYRRRYDQAKAIMHAHHPDYPPQRCHLHGMLLATKLLLKNLWIEWNKGRAGDPLPVTESVSAALS